MKCYLICVIFGVFTTISNQHELFIEDFEHENIIGEFNKNLVVMVYDKREVTVHFPVSVSAAPFVVNTWSNFNEFHYPVFVMVRQQKLATSWELPLQVATSNDSDRYYNVSRILCHDDMKSITILPRNITRFSETRPLFKKMAVQISTFSKIPTKITLRGEEMQDFYIFENKSYSTIISPSTPKYYYYQFSNEVKEKNITSTVILEVTSEDDVCLLVSVQRPTCPVMDLNQNIQYRGKYQTVNKKGGIIIKSSEFPDGFFVVFVAQGDNLNCDGEPSSLKTGFTSKIESHRISSIEFNIYNSISNNEYLLASLTTLAAFFAFYVVFSFMTWAFYRYNYRNKVSDEENSPDHVPTQRENVALNVDDHIDAQLARTHLVLSDLAKKHPEKFENQSLAYLWNVISVAIFYGIPVVQLVITYQKVVNVSGNQDICYYNFLCAYPLNGISDFNHIYSNIGYILVGFLFLGIVSYRRFRIPHHYGLGIPKHYGLFYAMGVSLIMEGILSACYHICPNQSNFQFDTSFMYVMAVLNIVKLYQNRHPDINATAYTTFLLLGFAIFAAMVGILDGRLFVWIVFMVFYIILCIFISLNVYFLNYVKRGVAGVMNEWNEDHNLRRTFTPKRKFHFCLLLVAILVNTGMALCGILCYINEIDFGTYLLGLLMGNAILYMFLYVIMKITHGEKLCGQAIIYGILSFLFWIAGAYFFMNNSTMWTVSAAESRQWNKHCSLLKFYDLHDIWHLLSAAALFFSFMLLLCMDDDLLNVPHNKIIVF